MNVKQLIDYDTASVMYKIAKGTAPEYTQSMFEKCDATHSYNTRSARNGKRYYPQNPKDKQHLCILVPMCGTT